MERHRLNGFAWLSSSRNQHLTEIHSMETSQHLSSRVHDFSLSKPSNLTEAGMHAVCKSRNAHLDWSVALKVVSLRSPVSRKASKPKRVQSTPGGDTDVFFSIYGEGHWAAVNVSAGLKMPEDIAGSGIEQDEIPLSIASKQHSAGS